MCYDIASEYCVAYYNGVMPWEFCECFGVEASAEGASERGKGR